MIEYIVKLIYTLLIKKEKEEVIQMKRLIKRIFRVLSTVFSCEDRIIMRKVKVFKNNSFLQRSLYVLFNLLVLFLLLGIPFLGIAKA